MFDPMFVFEVSTPQGVFVGRVEPLDEGSAMTTATWRAFLPVVETAPYRQEVHFCHKVDLLQICFFPSGRMAVFTVADHAGVTEIEVPYSALHALVHFPDDEDQSLLPDEFEALLEEV